MEDVHLRSSDFRRERQAQWLQLEAMVKRVEKSGLASLTADQLHKLPGHYRAAVSSLSVARAISLDKNLLVYLESLVARSYLCVYGVKPRAGAVVKSFFMKIFPETVRRYYLGVIIAIVIMLAGVVIGFFLDDPEDFHAVMPEGLAEGRSPASTTEELREILYSNQKSDTSLGFFATYLFTHNTKVAIFSFALGFALGVLTIILLFYNGLTLGALAGLYASRGLSTEFWAWVMPHGITELLAICLCGGAGIEIGLAIIKPGRYGRLHSLKKTGRRTSMIILGAAMMLLVAGLIEGFFRQLVNDVFTRYALASATFAFWWFYLIIHSKQRRRS